jgi:OmpA-OmpF porin, OOP family
MVYLNRILVSTAVAAAFSPALAADKPWGGRPGYVVDTQNVPVTSASGQCWKTTDWTPVLAVEPCDPAPLRLVTAPKPKPVVQAAPPPPPPPPAPKIVVRSIDLSADTLFGFDEASLQPEGKSMLNDLARELRAVRYDTVVVVGHADRIGPPQYNQKLSERRAQAVKEFLATEAQVPPERISVDSKGSAEPVTRPEDCKGQRGDAAIECLAPDRRVQVQVNGTKEEVIQGR